MPSGDASTRTMSQRDPSRSGQDDDAESTVVNVPTSSGPPQLLQIDAADREAECERRRVNDNESPREDKPDGKNLDLTCLRLAIEQPGTTNRGKETVYYFCIVCDKTRANNSRIRAFEHTQPLSCFLHQLYEIPSIQCLPTKLMVVFYCQRLLPLLKYGCPAVSASLAELGIVYGKVGRVN